MTTQAEVRKQEFKESSACMLSEISALAANIDEVLANCDLGRPLAVPEAVPAISGISHHARLAEARHARRERILLTLPVQIVS